MTSKQRIAPEIKTTTTEISEFSLKMKESQNIKAVTNADTPTMMVIISTIS